MHDIPRVSFLLVLNGLLLAMLVMILGGCVSTPAQNRYRHGDFIMNIGSTAETVERVAAAETPATAPAGLAASNTPSRG